MASKTAPPSFASRYAAVDIPWAIDAPQPALVELAEQEKIVGDVLDLGCGVGDNSLMMARRGHYVWGLDQEPEALRRAREKQDQQKIEDVTFIEGRMTDVLHFGEGFHTVLDSGMFHFLDDSEHADYLECLRHVMFPNSRLFLLVLADKPSPHLEGATGIKRSEIRHLFTAQNGFRVKHIEPVDYVLKTEGVKAWLATIIRLAD